MFQMLFRRRNYKSSEEQVRPRAGGRNRGRTVRALVAGLVLVGVLAAVGCTSGSYPVDIFYEQHYQQSYKSHEPPRLVGVSGAVAFYPPPPNTTDSSTVHLYEVNCLMCHGAGARGDGPVLSLLINEYGYETAITPDLTTLTPEAIEGFLKVTVRPFGPASVMPPFGKLLSEEERWSLANYIDGLPK